MRGSSHCICPNVLKHSRRSFKYLYELGKFLEDIYLLTAQKLSQFLTDIHLSGKRLLQNQSKLFAKITELIAECEENVWIEASISGQYFSSFTKTYTKKALCDKRIGIYHLAHSKPKSNRYQNPDPIFERYGTEPEIQVHRDSC